MTEPSPGGARARPGYSRRFPSSLLSAEIWLERGLVAARLGGELDIYSAADLGAALGEAQREADRGSVLFLLEALTFADSSALGVFVGALKRARAAGGGVALVGVPEFLLKTLRVTGLATHLPAFATVEEGWDRLETASGRAEAPENTHTQ
ncbi:STAS domain-containing protein [Actinospica durhamensis]|uniref:Anti-sigma factor antagonist n=1 Tax=Actinospica durhamensis TaxID=1508375 RepID=A0A941IRE6_9ACTN|nr:STAS domain-containing protein [Actinospica durhamensis]MBR7837269.1 STAS domain-containing protein [Actinospica durhamensis]